MGFIVKSVSPVHSSGNERWRYCNSKKDYLRYTVPVVWQEEGAPTLRSIITTMGSGNREQFGAVMVKESSGKLGVFFFSFFLSIFFYPYMDCF